MVYNNIDFSLNYIFRMVIISSMYPTVIFLNFTFSVTSLLIILSHGNGEREDAPRIAIIGHLPDERSTGIQTAQQEPPKKRKNAAVCNFVPSLCFSTSPGQRSSDSDAGFDGVKQCTGPWTRNKTDQKGKRIPIGT